MVLKDISKKLIPHAFQPKAKEYYYKIISPFFIGDNVYCHCCEKSFSRFTTLDYEKEIVCPGCGSFRRHRLLFSYLKEKTDFFTDKFKMLDIAPLYYQQQKFRKLKNIDYLSADLTSPYVMEHFDLTDIPYEDNKFDVIFCYHVLEHIENDKKAISELYRILKPGGWSIIQTPIDYSREVTYEDFSISSPSERKVHFGQEDHVRYYGKDYLSRLENPGFKVTELDYVGSFTKHEQTKFGFDSQELLYICNK